MSTPLPAELTIVEVIECLWCPHCSLSTAVEIRSVATRSDRPDLPPLARGRTIECERCERELIEPEVDVTGSDGRLFVIPDAPGVSGQTQEGS